MLDEMIVNPIFLSNAFGAILLVGSRRCAKKVTLVDEQINNPSPRHNKIINNLREARNRITNDLAHAENGFVYSGRQNGKPKFFIYRFRGNVIGRF